MPRIDRGTNGTCFDCPNKTGGLYRRCAVCRKRNSDVNKRRRHKRRAASECVSCGSGTNGGPRCKSCTPRRVASTRRLHLSKRELLRRLKDKPCTDCGRHWPSPFMEFDHVRGNKLFTLAANGKGHSTDIILREVAKCDVRCLVCHRARTCGVPIPDGFS